MAEFIVEINVQEVDDVEYDFTNHRFILRMKPAKDAFHVMSRKLNEKRLLSHYTYYVDKYGKLERF
jgi:hypothetical protein